MNDQICSLLFNSFYHAQGGSELQWMFNPSSELNFVLLVQQKDDIKFECLFLTKWQQRWCWFIHIYLSASLHLAVWWQSQNLTPWCCGCRPARYFQADGKSHNKNTQYSEQQNCETCTANHTTRTHSIKLTHKSHSQLAITSVHFSLDFHVAFNWVKVID